MAGAGRAAAILLNGTSSSGKTSLARALQCLLQPPHLYFGFDTFLLSLPPSLHGREEGVRFAEVGTSDGSPWMTIEVGREALPLFEAAHRAMALLVRNGVPVVLDEALVSEELRASYRRAFVGLRLVTVKVTCDLAVAEARERARGDRVPGLAVGMAGTVHDGMRYDLEVDTSDGDLATAARDLAAAVDARRGQ